TRSRPLPRCRVSRGLQTCREPGSILVAPPQTNINREPLMAQSAASRIPATLKTHESNLLADWLKEQLAASTLRADLLKEADLREQSRSFLNLLQVASQRGSVEDIAGPDWAPLKDFL